MRQSFILILDARGSEENVVDVASFLSHLLRAPAVQWQTIEHTVAVGAHQGYPISPLKVFWWSLVSSCVFLLTWSDDGTLNVVPRIRRVREFESEWGKAKVDIVLQPSGVKNRSVLLKGTNTILVPSPYRVYLHPYSKALPSLHFFLSSSLHFFLEENKKK